MESLDWTSPTIAKLGDIMDLCDRVDESAIDEQEAIDWQQDTLMQDHWDDYWDSNDD